VDPAKDFQDAVVIKSFGLLLLIAFVSQEDDLQQGNTAHVRAYPDCDQLVTKASSLAGAGRYVEALAIYEEAMEKHPDSVVPLDKTRAIGVREYVLNRIAAWPEEGQAACRRRTDPPADHRFQGAKRSRDVDALELLIEQYPHSSVVDDALGLIGNLHLDAGENERAAAALSRLQARAGTVDHAVVMARLGLAWARSGRRKLVEELAKRDHSGATILVGGKEALLSDHLKGLAAGMNEESAAAPPLALPAWEMLGGDPSGSRLAESGVKPTKLAWSDTIGLPRLDGDEAIFRGRARISTAEYRPLFPVVSDGVLYVHNGITLSAYNLFARTADRLWQFRVPPPAGEVMFDDRAIFAPAVHDGRVFANLITAVGGAEDQLGFVRVKFPFSRRALFAFDAATGKLLWNVGGKLHGDTLGEIATFSTGPTAEDGRLYIGATRQKISTDLFEHYVLCIDAATGRILWATFTASGGTEINLFGNSTRECLGTPVAVTEDSVFVSTNHGVIAALEKKTGRIRWTWRYRQLPVMPTRNVNVTKNPLGWVNSPPVAARGIVVVTPTDSPYLYGLNARTGLLVWERLRGRDVRVIYGVKDATLVLGGERLEFCDIRTGRPTDATASPEIGATGRGVVAEDGIYVPCRDMLRKVGWDGRWIETASRRLTGGIGDGGNLVVVDGALVVATQEAIQVYFDRRDQEKEILEALERDPDNPALLYRGAIRYLQSGATDPAATLLARAVGIMAKSSRPENERLYHAACKRLFSVTMEGGRAELQAGRLAEAGRRFAEARSCAVDAPSRIEAALACARVHLMGKEDALAVNEYQSLLLEEEADFDLARHAIAAILTTVGRVLYAAHEGRAAALLNVATTAEELFKVFRLYPNSRAAEAALYKRAMAPGREDDEIAALRLFLREFSESNLAPEATASLVRRLEKKGHHASAGTLLRRMARMFPDGEVTDDGRKVKARDFAERRLATEVHGRPLEAEPLSRLAPPVRKFFEFTEKEDYSEGAPLRAEGVPPVGTADLILMQYAKHGAAAVKAIDSRTGKEVWQHKLGSMVRFASFLEEALLIADDTSLVRLDPRDGKVEWRYASKTTMRGFALAGTLLFFFADEPRDRSPQVLALDTLSGTPTWKQELEGGICPQIHPIGESIVFITIHPNRIHLFEAETGKRLLEDGGFSAGISFKLIHATTGLLVLQAEGRFLEGYDLPSGLLRWRVPLRVSTRAVKVASDRLLFLGTRPVPVGDEERLFLMVLDLPTGKILRHQESPPVGDGRFLLLDGDQAVIVSREPDNSIGVRAVALSDFSVRWTTALGEKGSTPLLPFLSRDHIVVGRFEENANGRYAYGAALLDKTGRVAQDIRSEFEFERPPDYEVVDDRLFFSEGKRVDVYR
jgi:outer membrane protein assembly factor BamB/tetratricopeptide (TPR) repeat protein